MLILKLVLVTVFGLMLGASIAFVMVASLMLAVGLL